MGKLKDALKTAFEVDRSEFCPTQRQRIIVDAIARKIVRHGMGTVAILFLESFRPMNYVASQGLVFLEPILKGTLFGDDYTEFYRMLEHRGSVDYIVERIEFYIKSTDQRRRRKRKITGGSDVDQEP